METPTDIFDTLYTSLVTNKEEAEAFIQRMVDENKDYHLDDNPEDMITWETGDLLFTEPEAKAIALRVSACFEHLDDPFENLVAAIGVREAKAEV